MENMVLHLKLVRGVREVPLAYVVCCHIKVKHFLNESDKHYNFGEEMIARASILNKM